jgi:hypothetical protein
MKKLLMTATAAACLVALSAIAQQEGKKEPSPEQKQARKEMIDKYDTNKDGKLDKEERAKMSEEDKATMKKMRGGKGGKGGKQGKGSGGSGDQGQ